MEILKKKKYRRTDCKRKTEHENPRTHTHTANKKTHGLRTERRPREIEETIKKYIDFSS